VFRSCQMRRPLTCPLPYLLEEEVGGGVSWLSPVPGTSGFHISGKGGGGSTIHRNQVLRKFLAH